MWHLRSVLMENIKKTLNLEPNDDNHSVTKVYVDSLSENDRKWRDLSTVFNYQDNDFDNK